MGFTGRLQIPVIGTKKNGTVRPTTSYNNFLLQFPSTSEVIVKGHPKFWMEEPKRPYIENATRSLRAALLTGAFPRLKRLVFVADLDTLSQTAQTFVYDLTAIFKSKSLSHLMILTLNLGDDAGWLQFRTMAVLSDFFEAASTGLPLLQDFDVNFGIDSDPDSSSRLAEPFLEKTWPSLTILRSCYITARRHFDLAHEEANGFGNGMGGLNFAGDLALAFAKGHFPKVKTLVVGEVSFSNPALGLPRCGLPQVKKLVLVGRLLKNPLLNFSMPSTQIERSRGGGGVIQTSLFKGLETLDISCLYCSPVYGRWTLTEPPFSMTDQEILNYQQEFAVNTCRAIGNLRVAVSGSAFPELVLSDSFLVHHPTIFDGRPFSVMIGSAVQECLESFRPKTLRVAKLYTSWEKERYYGCTHYYSVHKDRASLSYGCLLDDYSENRSRIGRIVHDFLDTSPYLQSHLTTLEMDSLYFTSYRQIIETLQNEEGVAAVRDEIENLIERGVNNWPDVYSWTDDEHFPDGEEILESLDTIDRTGAANLIEWTCEQLLRRLRLLEECHHVSDYTCVDVIEYTCLEVFDYTEVLSKYSQLETLVVFQGPESQGYDLEQYCTLPPIGCKLIIHEDGDSFRSQQHFIKHAWMPFLKRCKEESKKIFQYFPPISPHTLPLEPPRVDVSVVFLAGSGNVSTEIDVIPSSDGDKRQVCGGLSALIPRNVVFKSALPRGEESEGQKVSSLFH